MTFDAEMTQMLDDVYETFGVAVTIRKVERANFNPTTGQRAETLTDIAVTANRLPIEEGSFPAAIGRVSKQDRIYEVAASDVGEKPQAGWRLIDGSDTLEIFDVRTDVDKKNYVIRCGAES